MSDCCASSSLLITPIPYFESESSEIYEGSSNSDSSDSEIETVELLNPWEMDSNVNPKFRAVPLALQPIISILSPSSSFDRTKTDNHKSSTKRSLGGDKLECHLQTMDEIKQRFDCPKRPPSITKTHLQLRLKDNGDLKDVVNNINICLSQFMDYDFSYLERSSMWKGKFIQGSRSCIIHINLYCELNSLNSYIIEAIRVSGDAKPFREFFQDFERMMTNNPKLYQSEFDGGFLGSGRELISCSPASRLSPEQFLKSLEPIESMAKSSYFDVKIEAAKMLCDISTHDHLLLSHVLCVDRIVSLLEMLVLNSSAFPSVQEQALIALAEFADIPGFAPRIVVSDVLPVVMSLISNAPKDGTEFETAQLRRQCARMVVNLCIFDTHSIVRKLDAKAFCVTKWMQSVHELSDNRTQIYAMRICEYVLKSLQR